ncbi:MAG TPA: ABC transporter permease [Candidatus Dormibacteraeota bacterium]|nr:ABC transporter permease [Candidatus Dormibacteraeota bacterium]
MTGAAPAVARPPARLAHAVVVVRRALLTGDRFGVASVAFLLLLVLLALVAPLISPYDPVHVTSDTLAGPGLRHPFGTDQFGRDVLSRILWGARLTLAAPVVGIGISTAVGVPLGLVAGYSSRWISGLIMRTMDVLLAFPGLLLALIVVTIIGSGLLNVMVAIGIAFVPVFARVVYGSTLAVRGRDYVTAAQSIGCTSRWIVGRHILPNVATQVVVVASSAIGWALLTATTLNFLGFGVKLPTPEWGADLAAGKDWLQLAWWTSTFPGLAITLVILASNYLGDHIAAVLEPHSHWRDLVQQVGMEGLQ